MVVVDASVLANAIADYGMAGDLARARLAADPELVAPDLVDVETTSVLRRRWQAGSIDEVTFQRGVETLMSFRLVRVPTRSLLLRAYDLRHNLTPYDACYVALAEELTCPLLTIDARLSRAPGVTCAIEVLAS
ncbi:MAG: type II toxin-antitoxin system VapC family toxin [Chloroflexota bacterium]